MAKSFSIMAFMITSVIIGALACQKNVDVSTIPEETLTAASVQSIAYNSTSIQLSIKATNANCEGQQSCGSPEYAERYAIAKRAALTIANRTCQSSRICTACCEDGMVKWTLEEVRPTNVRCLRLLFNAELVRNPLNPNVVLVKIIRNTNQIYTSDTRLSLLDGLSDRVIQERVFLRSESTTFFTIPNSSSSLILKAE
jgi:hypothetical protein